MSNPATEAQKHVLVEDPVYRHFSSSLRILGDGLDFDEISRTLGLKPTHLQRKGELRKPGLKPWPHDAWIYRPAVDRDRPLDEHILAVWNAIRTQMTYLRRLKQRFQVDVLCTYNCNSDMAGFKVDHHSLGLFAELEIPFEVSVLIM